MSASQRRSGEGRRVKSRGGRIEGGRGWAGSLAANDLRLAKSISIQRDLQAVAPMTSSIAANLTNEEKKAAERLCENLQPFGITLPEISELIVKFGIGSPELENQVNMIANESLDGLQAWHSANKARESKTFIGRRGASPSRGRRALGRVGAVGKGGGPATQSRRRGPWQQQANVKTDVAAPAEPSSNKEVFTTTTQRKNEPKVVTEIPPTKPASPAEPVSPAKPVPTNPTTWAALLRRSTRTEVLPSPIVAESHKCPIANDDDPPPAAEFKPLSSKEAASAQVRTDLPFPATKEVKPIQSERLVSMSETQPSPTLRSTGTKSERASASKNKLAMSSVITAPVSTGNAPVAGQKGRSVPHTSMDERPADDTQQPAAPLNVGFAPPTPALQAVPAPELQGQTREMSVCTVYQQAPSRTPTAAPSTVAEEVLCVEAPPADPVIIPPSATAFHVKSDLQRHSVDQPGGNLQFDQPCVVLPHFLTNVTTQQTNQSPPQFVFGSYRRKDMDFAVEPTMRHGMGSSNERYVSPYHSEGTDTSAAGGEALRRPAMNTSRNYHQYAPYAGAVDLVQATATDAAAPNTYPASYTSHVFNSRYYMSAGVPPTSTPAQTSNPPSAAYPASYTQEQTEAPNAGRHPRPGEYMQTWGLYPQTTSLEYQPYAAPAYTMGVFPHPFMVNPTTAETQEASKLVGTAPECEHRHGLNTFPPLSRPPTTLSRIMDNTNYGRASDRTYPPPGLGGGSSVEQISIRNPMGPFGNGPVNPATSDDATAYRHNTSSVYPITQQQQPNALYLPYQNYQTAPNTDEGATDMLERTTMQPKQHPCNMLSANFMAHQLRSNPNLALQWAASGTEAAVEDFPTSAQAADNDNTSSRLPVPHQYDLLRPNPALLGRMELDARGTSNKAEMLPSAMAGPQYHNRYNTYAYSNWPSPRTMSGLNFQSNEGFRR